MSHLYLERGVPVSWLRSLTGDGRRFCRTAVLAAAVLGSANAGAQEMILGEKTLPEGIHLVFEGGVKDTVTPEVLHLSEAHTDVHIEVLANWAEKDIPDGAPPGGFIPYLLVSVEISNERTSKATHARLLPHVNMADNFHYARNISLPGGVADRYTAVFHIHPPGPFDLAFHQRWKSRYVRNNRLLEPVSFTFRKLDFKAVAEATRK